MKTSNTLKELVNALPDKPGVYQYFNVNNEIIYVGKAKNLKKRVNSYFNKVHELSKTSVLVKNITAQERQHLQWLIKRHFLTGTATNLSAKTRRMNRRN